MVRLSKYQIKKYMKFLMDNRQYVGLSDWTIILKTELLTEGENYASSTVNKLEKELTIQLSTNFLKESKAKQANILFHELVHARLGYMYQKIDEYREVEEEHMINDLVRGYETLGELWIG